MNYAGEDEDHSTPAMTYPAKQKLASSLLLSAANSTQTGELAVGSPPNVVSAEYKGPKALGLDRKYKWVSESKSSGDRSSEIKGPEDENEAEIDRKYKWIAAAERNGAGVVKWSAEIKGKGRFAPVSRVYSWQSSTVASVCEDHLRKEKEKEKVKEKGKKGKMCSVARDRGDESESSCCCYQEGLFAAQKMKRKRRGKGRIEVRRKKVNSQMPSHHEN